MKEKYIKIYKNLIKEYENLSSCARLRVAALLVKDGRIMSVGYNGVPSGKDHCDTIFKHDRDRYFIYDEEVSEAVWLEKHHRFSVKNEIHAEMNTIAFAVKNNVNVSDCDLIVSVTPCIHCAKLIQSVGLKRVYYFGEYDRSPSEGIKFLRSNGVLCYNLNEDDRVV